MPKKIEVAVNFYDGSLQEMTFAELAELWYMTWQRNIEPSTYDSYQYTLDKLISVFGAFQPEQIHPYHIEQFQQAAAAAGLSVSYQTKLRSMMHQIMQMAVSGGLCVTNPVAGAQSLRHLQQVARQQIPKDSFTVHEIQAICEFLPLDRMGCAIRLLIFSGLRCQELLALEPRHIAPDLSSIRVEQAVKVAKGKTYIGPPKSAAGRRLVPIPAVVRPCVQLLIQQSGHFLIPGKLDHAGVPYSPRSWRKRYYRVMERVPEVRPLPPHCCRHTYVSQLHASGVDMETIQSLVGHADMTMTEHYLHIQPEVAIAAVRRLDQMAVAI